MPHCEYFQSQWGIDIMIQYAPEYGGYLNRFVFQACAEFRGVTPC